MLKVKTVHLDEILIRSQSVYNREGERYKCLGQLAKKMDVFRYD